MRRLALILVLSLPLAAQVQGNRPELIDSVTSDNGSTYNGTLTYPEPVSVGDFLDVCVATFDGLNTQYGVTSSLGNTYTLTAKTQLPNIGGDSRTVIYHAYTVSGFSGTETVTLAIPSPSQTNYRLAIARYRGVATVDGSVAVSTYNGNAGGGLGTVSTTQTTTTNNDILSTCGAPGAFGTTWMTLGTGEFGAWAFGANNTHIHMSHQHAGAAGSQTVTVNTYNDFAFGGYASFGIQTLAIKPTSIQVPDTQLPDAGKSIAYFAQLHCSGGTSTQSWIITGTPPTGLSFNTTTGQITGTPSGSPGTTSLGFQCTDGTVTSATQTLGLTVAASLQTPTIRTVAPNSGDVFGTWGNPIGVICGDYVLALVRGVDGHYNQGWVQAAAGTNTKVTSNLNAPIRRMTGFLPGATSSPLTAYVIGPYTQNGSDIISVFPGSGSGANPVSLLIDIGGGEIVDDATGVTTFTNTATGTFGTSFTTTVPNMMVISQALTWVDTTHVATLAQSAPFSTVLSYRGDASGDSLYMSTGIVGSPSSVSGTVSYTGGHTTFMDWAQLLVGVRPAPAPSNCPAPAGEQIRPWSY